MGSFRSIEASSHRRRDEDGRDRGFTLLEVVIYFTLLVIFTAPIVLMTLEMTRSTEESGVTNVILERNRSTLTRLSADFREAMDGTAVIGSNGKSLTFTLAGGFDGSTVTTGDTIRFDIESVANGTAGTSGRIVRTNETTKEAVVISEFIDAGSSGFAQSSTGVTATITTTGRSVAGSSDRVMTRTIRLYPRNS